MGGRQSCATLVAVAMLVALLASLHMDSALVEEDLTVETTETLTVPAEAANPKLHNTGMSQSGRIQRLLRKKVLNGHCASLLEDERWRFYSEELWERNNRSVETFPVRKQDPIMMIKTQEGVALPVPFAMCTIEKNGCSRWRRLMRRVAGFKTYLENPHSKCCNGLRVSVLFSLPNKWRT